MEPTSIPAAGHLLCAVAERFGIASEELFTEPGLKLVARQSKSVCLTHAQIVQAAVRACALTGEPGLGFPLGLQLRLHIHELAFGAAALFAQTVRDMLRLFLHVQGARQVAVLQEEGERAALIFEDRGDRGAAREVILLCLLTGFAQAAEDLARDAIERIELAIDRPEYLPRFVHLPITRKMHFGQAHNRLCGPARFLDLPFSAIKSVDIERIRARCEHDLSVFGGRKLRHRVLGVLRNDPTQTPSLGEAAALLAISPRTLKRRLAEQGTTYSALRQEVCLAHAEDRLLRTDATIEALAEQLGFSDAASFIRAFRRWTGLTPARYRALRR